MGKVLFFFVTFASFRLWTALDYSFGRKISERIWSGRTRMEEAPIPTGGLLFWVTFRDAEEGQSLGSCHRFFEIRESQRPKKAEWPSFYILKNSKEPVVPVSLAFLEDCHTRRG